MIGAWILLAGVYAAGYIIGRKDGREAQFRDDFMRHRQIKAAVDKIEPRKQSADGSSLLGLTDFPRIDLEAWVEAIDADDCGEDL